MRTHHLESGKHTVGAIQLAAHRLCVDMAAGQHRRQFGLPGPAKKQVAAIVDRHCAAQGSRLIDQVAPSLDIDRGEGLARHPAIAAPTKACERGDRRVQPRRIDRVLRLFRAAGGIRMLVHCLCSWRVMSSMPAIGYG